MKLRGPVRVVRAQPSNTNGLKVLEDIYRGYRIKVAGEDFWVAKISHIISGRYLPLEVTVPRDKRPEHCRNLARQELDRYIAFIGED